MATLYELTGKYHQLLDLAEDTDPTLFNDTMDSITDAIEDKAVGYAKVRKEIVGDINKIDDELKILKSRKKSLVRSQEHLETTLGNAMAELGIDKIKTPLVTVKVAKTPKYDVNVNKDELPASYYRQKEEPDKPRIKEDLKNGKEIKGATLIVTPSMRFS